MREIVSTSVTILKQGCHSAGAPIRRFSRDVRVRGLAYLEMDKGLLSLEVCRLRSRQLDSCSIRCFNTSSCFYFFKLYSYIDDSSALH